MKGEIAQLGRQVQIEKTNLSQKVTQELDSTLKKAVKEKVKIQQEMEMEIEGKKKLQRDFDELQEMYNKQVRQNIELQQSQVRVPNHEGRGYNKVPEPMAKQSVYLPPIQKYQPPVE